MRKLRPCTAKAINKPCRPGAQRDLHDAHEGSPDLRLRCISPVYALLGLLCSPRLCLFCVSKRTPSCPPPVSLPSSCSLRPLALYPLAASGWGPSWWATVPPPCPLPTHHSVSTSGVRTRTPHLLTSVGGAQINSSTNRSLPHPRLCETPTPPQGQDLRLRERAGLCPKLVNSGPRLPWDQSIPTQRQEVRTPPHRTQPPSRQSF